MLFFVQIHKVRISGWLSEVFGAFLFLANLGLLISCTGANEHLSDSLNIRPAAVFTQTKATSPTVSNVPSLTFGGDCTVGLEISVKVTKNSGPQQVVPVSPICASNSTWTVTLTRASDGTEDGSWSYLFSQTYFDGSVRTALVIWELITQGPVLTISPTTTINNLSIMPFTGNCEDGLVVTVSQSLRPNPQVFSTTVNCTGGAWSSFISAGLDGVYDISATQTDAAGNTATAAAVWTRNTTPPVVTANSLLLNAGASSTVNNYVSVGVSATSTQVPVAAFCLKEDSLGAPSPPAPSTEDGCWTSLKVFSACSPTITPSMSVVVPGGHCDNGFHVGFIQGKYIVYAWAMDVAGNISGDPVAANATAVIQYNPPSPPTVTNVIASSSSTPNSPLQSSDTLIGSGSPTYISWNVSAGSSALITNPISIFYTSDGTTYTVALSGIPNGASNGCGSVPAGQTGCVVINNPVGTGFFRFRVAATGSPNVTAMGLSNPLNTGKFSFLAGNVDTGEGGYATAAVVSPTSTQGLVVDQHGRIFVVDKRGLMMVSQETGGTAKNLIPFGVSESSGTVGVDRPTGALMGATRIALEYSGNLLIRSADAIFELDTTQTPFQLNQLVLKTNGVPVTITDDRAGGAGNRIFTALPNGDILFQATNFDAAGSTISWYHKSASASNNVETISLQGHINFEANISDFSPPEPVNLQNCLFRNAGVTYYPKDTSANPLTSLLLFVSPSGTWTNLNPPNSGDCTVGSPVLDNGQFVSLDPVTFVPVLDPPISTLAHNPVSVGTGFRELYDHLQTGMDGQLYMWDLQVYKALLKYNAGNWQVVAGAFPNYLANPGDSNSQEYRGHCTDGTAATSCPVRISSMFIDSQSQIYFLDDNTVRTIQGGNVYTLAGQRHSTGDSSDSVSADGSLPVDARIGDTVEDVLTWTDGSNNDLIDFNDITDWSFREVKLPSGGGKPSVYRRAGNGNPPAPGDPGTPIGTSATQYALSFSDTDCYLTNMVLDPTNGDIYLNPRCGQANFKIDVSGTYSAIGPSNGDLIQGYGAHPIGYSNRNLLSGSFTCSFSIPTIDGCSANSKFWDIDATQSNVYSLAVGLNGFIGYYGSNWFTWCVGEWGFGNVAACQFGLLSSQGTSWVDAWTVDPVYPWGSQLAHAEIDQSDGGWLLLEKNDVNVYKLIAGGGSFTYGIKKFATFDQNARSFTMVPGGETLYYCSSSDGHLHTHTVGGLPGSDTTISYGGLEGVMVCGDGANGANGEVVWNPHRNSVIFSYRLNNLTGIAEYVP